MNSFFTRFLAFIVLVISIPLLIIVAILIVVIDNHNPIFKQERVGLNQSFFTIIKFKTMKNGHITSFGRVLRKTGIDEIPQLINILKGDINFIGPRPLTQFDINRLEWNTNYHTLRWAVKPGLTGLGQLSPICHKKMTLFWDTYYVRHKNIGLKLKIIGLTCLTLVLGKSKVKKIIQNNLHK